MVQTDPNIRIPGAERKPGNVLPDQLLDLLMVDAGSSSLDYDAFANGYERNEKCCWRHSF